MRNNWLFIPNADIGSGCPHNFPIEFHISQGVGTHLLSQLSSLMDNSFYHSNRLSSSGRLLLQRTFSSISEFAGALFPWLSTGGNSNIFHKLLLSSCDSSKFWQSCSLTGNSSSSGQNLMGLQFGFGSNAAISVFFSRLANSSIQWLQKELEQHQVFPILSLAAAFVPPFRNHSSMILTDLVTPEAIGEGINKHVDMLLTENNYRCCSRPATSNVSWGSDAIEPKTGIKFPISLDSSLGECTSNMATEVLVGTGSRSMRIIKVKSMKVYAFGLYVYPDSLCEKLARKYASVPINELGNRSDFFEDLLREDINMTLRLVINCNYLKISTVRDAFEKSLRTRLHKMNPNTDYRCLSVFRSYFMQDIPLPIGTAINFRQTADGQLITEIGGKQIGSVHSKDLCKSFFDMYIGDAPVSLQAKQEVAQNVAGLIRRC